MDKHTPGPWTFEQHDGIDCTVYADNSVLAELRDIYDGNRCAANARLIAAAPELLEACKQLTSIAEQLVLPKFATRDMPALLPFTDAIASVLAVIAKAQGSV